MKFRSVIHRYLEPSDTLAEVLFGLIMVLTFTVGAQLLSDEEGFDTRQLVAAAIGCNIAWGVIDATLYLLDTLFYRSRRARFFRTLRAAPSEAAALAAMQDEFGLEDVPLAVQPEDRARLYESMLALSAHAAPARVRLRREDYLAAVYVFLLVSATAVPGAIPLLLVKDSHLALRLSNLVLLILLFLVGYRWAHFTDARPWRVAASVTLLGLAMVLLAVVLGG
jgi:hypothetical protein